MTDDQVREWVERYIASICWSEDTPDEHKTSVAGNIRTAISRFHDSTKLKENEKPSHMGQAEFNVATEVWKSCDHILNHLTKLGQEISDVKESTQLAFPEPLPCPDCGSLPVAIFPEEGLLAVQCPRKCEDYLIYFSVTSTQDRRMALSVWWKRWNNLIHEYTKKHPDKKDS